MSSLSTLVLSLSVISAAAVPDPALKGFLDPNDPVAISFWIISIAMVAATVFFLMESMTVAYHWKTSLNVGALVTLVAAVHYFYMREFWVQIGSSPIVYRYIDWSITVPLQMVEFYLILSAVQPNIGAGMFWRLLLGTVAMLAAGYSGEAGFVNAWAGFVVGMAGWGFILYEIFVGEAGSPSSAPSCMFASSLRTPSPLPFLVPCLSEEAHGHGGRKWTRPAQGRHRHKELRL